MTDVQKVREVLVNNLDESDPKKNLTSAKQIMKEVAKKKILMCGSEGKGRL
ncbi:MAG: hypothetical protein WBG30_03595 [Psychrilyobacter sp.]|uniref:hypothetical protein n=1 Tax=Psychrilyobacter sp. TaxID=2586924 RepID=UPI003C74602F